MAQELYVYYVKYRPFIPGRIRHLVVGAFDADDARAQARILDPEFGHTTESPRRGRVIEPPDGMDEAKRAEWLNDDSRHATWQGVEVEVS